MALEIDIGQRIRSHRQSNHLTLKQLAEKVGCTDAYLSQIENGRVSPSIASLKKSPARYRVRLQTFSWRVRMMIPWSLSRTSGSLSLWIDGTRKSNPSW